MSSVLFEWFPKPCNTPGCNGGKTHFHPGVYARIKQVANETISIEALFIDSDLTQHTFNYKTSLFPSICYCLDVLSKEENPSLIDWYSKIVLPMVQKDAIELEKIYHGI